ncbi:hypothetical protein HMSSN036_62730 [Paenibacillus macerans]|nr:hypothetical protein HMSSN036_62730 [Paenibacillus macerans]
MGVGTAAGMALVTAVLLMLFRQSVAEIYSSDSEVVALTKHFLIYAIFFQMSDAIATPTQGVLRGYKDVNPGFGSPCWLTGSSGFRSDLCWPTIRRKAPTATGSA